MSDVRFDVNQGGSPMLIISTTDPAGKIELVLSTEELKDLLKSGMSVLTGDHSA
ncbi:hypothetical protein HHTV1_57 [Haloarcula hispanica tailed virus 1]|uniref:Uncharacterized protein n=1 Tax=Haloarcula hispanica tailed virus 1 TaxID=1273750 RepID=R4TGE5_9CAUD|nr:hypothetical protein M198_gp57 [Haloarcula hispanica tailed virus 1]AGM11311.1 hypothetical protein HHTV1_57 [Haloarcula hispanica tailed virus 1]